MSLAKTLVYLEGVLLVVMLLGVLSHRFALLPFKLAFGGFALSLLLAAVTALVALIVFGLSFGPLNSAARPFSLAAIALGMLPLIVVLATAGAGLKLPRIHDISTSPGAIEYVHAQSLRQPDENSLELAGPEVVAQQKAHYPDIQPIRTSLAPLQAYAVALSSAESLGWEITYKNESQLVFEAMEKTALFGFVDDVAVKVSPAGDDASQVDLRSVSRVGLGDLGANAKRIKKFGEVFAGLQDAKKQ